MHHETARPLNTPFWTPGVWVMLGFMLCGAGAVLARYIGGIGYVSNLTHARPWGIWIGIDVASGVALAAGGFTTAALAHIFGRHEYEPVVRPALLTAVLGYTFVVLGLMVDIGRTWAIWKPMIFWNFNSVLFEVGMCVMTYLTVLYIEFIPIAAERFGKTIPLLGRLNGLVGKIMGVFIVAGVVLSCMHQSSLGALLLVAPTKLHPLWYTPILPLLFLTSAFAVGYPMVIFETTIVTSSLRLDSEMKLLSRLSRFTVLLLGIYLALKIGDMIFRGTYAYLLDGTTQSNAFLVEVGLGVALPWILLWFPMVRTSRKSLFAVSTLIVFGVLLNRINVFLVGFSSPITHTRYFPAIGEILITAGLIASLMFIYRIVVTYLPVISAGKLEEVRP
ncbi:NrfD/PsrC family molybdoenzyme membrane anchor subunit [Desulfatirhabdium butyrativorans]|uniref:NrfD/PsrC family molybdoenzyme membrane anchor subunit n=1 Tax=Desulfatirhabdium butyrativorans TaxID=340467 RepID=UPI0003FBE254|nr:Ni/Fe-hydrogenase cytochrome b subunit [Desulfatirhabdium butyrativorans]